MIVNFVGSIYVEQQHTRSRGLHLNLALPFTCLAERSQLSDMAVAAGSVFCTYVSRIVYTSRVHVEGAIKRRLDSFSITLIGPDVTVVSNCFAKLSSNKYSLILE